MVRRFMWELRRLMQSRASDFGVFCRRGTGDEGHNWTVSDTVAERVNDFTVLLLEHWNARMDYSHYRIEFIHLTEDDTRRGRRGGGEGGGGGRGGRRGGGRGGAHAIDSQNEFARKIAFKNVPPNEGQWIQLGPDDANLSRYDRYINASPIRLPRRQYHGRHTVPQIIAAQGPIKKTTHAGQAGHADQPDGTIGDFWAMVWQEHTREIICVVAEDEFDRIGEVHTYWPEGGVGSSVVYDARPHGKFEVSLAREERRGNVIRRLLEIQRVEAPSYELGGDGDGGGKRFVIQHHLTNWRDMQLASNNHDILYLLDVIDRVLRSRDREHPEARPLVIHCNAGVGRTGVLCAIYALQQCIVDVRVSYADLQHLNVSHIHLRRARAKAEREQKREADRGGPTAERNPVGGSLRGVGKEGGGRDTKHTYARQHSAGSPMRREMGVSCMCLKSGNSGSPTLCCMPSNRGTGRTHREDQLDEYYRVVFPQGEGGEGKVGGGLGSRPGEEDVEEQKGAGYTAAVYPDTYDANGQMDHVNECLRAFHETYIAGRPLVLQRPTGNPAFSSDGDGGNGGDDGSSGEDDGGGRRASRHGSGGGEDSDPSSLNGTNPNPVVMQNVFQDFLNLNAGESTVRGGTAAPWACRACALHRETTGAQRCAACAWRTSRRGTSATDSDSEDDSSDDGAGGGGVFQNANGEIKRSTTARARARVKKNASARSADLDETMDVRSPIYYIVQALRKQRPFLISSPKQFSFCFDFIKWWLKRLAGVFSVEDLWQDSGDQDDVMGNAGGPPASSSAYPNDTNLGGGGGRDDNDGSSGEPVSSSIGDDEDGESDQSHFITGFRSPRSTGLSVQDVVAVWYTIERRDKMRLQQLVSAQNLVPMPGMGAGGHGNNGWESDDDEGGGDGGGSVAWQKKGVGIMFAHLDDCISYRDRLCINTEAAMVRVGRHLIRGNAFHLAALLGEGELLKIMIDQIKGDDVALSRLLEERADLWAEDVREVVRDYPAVGGGTGHVTRRVIEAQLEHGCYNVLHLGAVVGEVEVVRVVLEGLTSGAWGYQPTNAKSFLARLQAPAMTLPGQLDPALARQGNALHIACVEGSADVVKLLLQHGFDPNCVVKNRFSANKHAKWWDWDWLATDRNPRRRRLRPGSKRRMLRMSTSAGDYTGDYDEDWYTMRPLHLVACMGKDHCVEVTRALIDFADANIEAISEAGLTPLIEAARRPDAEKVSVLQTLCERRSNLDFWPTEYQTGKRTQRETNSSAYYSAEDAEVERGILNGRPPPWYVGHSALHHAVAIGNYGGVEVLMKFGADPNRKVMFEDIVEAAHDGDQAAQETRGMSSTTNGANGAGGNRSGGGSGGNLRGEVAGGESKDHGFEGFEGGKEYDDGDGGSGSDSGSDSEEEEDVVAGEVMSCLEYILLHSNTRDPSGKVLSALLLPTTHNKYKMGYGILAGGLRRALHRNPPDSDAFLQLFEYGWQSKAQTEAQDIDVKETVFRKKEEKARLKKHKSLVKGATSRERADSVESNASVASIVSIASRRLSAADTAMEQFASRNETTETQLGIHLRRLQEQGKFITQVEDAFADERGTTGSHRGYLMVYACKQLDNKMVDALLQLRDLTSIQLRDTMQVRIFKYVLNRESIL